MDPNATDALYPGDLNRLFEKIVTDPALQHYEPVVHSRPTLAPGDTKENATYQLGMWLVTFENVLSEEEAQRMIELGGIEGYKRSSDVGGELPDGRYEDVVSERRTSTNAWCTNDCYRDPIVQRLMGRIENITGIPRNNTGNLQLLRYEVGQFFQRHNDYIEYQVDRPCGVRILTFFFYLNEVEEGGGTNFPRLNLTVTPRRGRAALWPSVLNAFPNQKDARSDHQSLPVLKGVKYGANAWIHMRDFHTPNANGCT
jgi:prolyl 4-hydroxylase